MSTFRQHAKSSSGGRGRRGMKPPWTRMSFSSFVSKVAQDPSPSTHAKKRKLKDSDDSEDPDEQEEEEEEEEEEFPAHKISLKPTR